MATSLAACARHLSRQGLRHHVDVDQGVIRLVFVTRHYENRRGEHLAVVGIETPEGGRRVRVFISRAFACDDDPAAVCLALCGVAADMPLVRVEFDAPQADLRLVAESVVEDRALSRLQLAALIDRIVEAAEACGPVVATLRGLPLAGHGVLKKKRGVA